MSPVTRWIFPRNAPCVKRCARSPDIVPEIERVLLMAKGRIVADGPKSDVLQEERLSGLFGLKVQLGQRDGYYHIW